MMAINAGKMNRRIRFLDSNDFPADLDDRWFWCEFKTLGTSVRYQAMSVSPTISAEIHMRYTQLKDPYTGVPTDIIAGLKVQVENGKRYAIKSVLDVDERHEELILVVETI